MIGMAYMHDIAHLALSGDAASGISGESAAAGESSVVASSGVRGSAHGASDIAADRDSPSSGQSSKTDPGSERRTPSIAAENGALGNSAGSELSHSAPGDGLLRRPRPWAAPIARPAARIALAGGLAVAGWLLGAALAQPSASADERPSGSDDHPAAAAPHTDGQRAAAARPASSGTLTWSSPPTAGRTGNEPGGAAASDRGSRSATAPGAADRGSGSHAGKAGGRATDSAPSATPGGKLGTADGSYSGKHSSAGLKDPGEAPGTGGTASGERHGNGTSSSGKHS
ncbi:hypothetical protein ACPESJ_21985, partial [Amycolatopsis sulphurea]